MMTRFGSWMRNRYHEWQLEQERLSHIWDPDDKWDTLTGTVIAASAEQLQVSTRYDGVKTVRHSIALDRLFATADIGDIVLIEFNGELTSKLLEHTYKNFTWNVRTPSGASLASRGSGAPICSGERAPVDRLTLGATSGISGSAVRIQRSLKKFICDATGT